MRLTCSCKVALAQLRERWAVQGICAGRLQVPAADIDLSRLHLLRAARSWIEREGVSVVAREVDRRVLLPFSRLKALALATHAVETTRLHSIIDVLIACIHL